MESSLTDKHIVGEDMLMTFCKFYLRLCVSSDQWKNCVGKILLVTWRIFLYENNCNYNFYKFIKRFFRIRFYPFFSFPKNQNKKSNIRQVGDLVKKNISVFSLQLVALYFKNISNLIDFYKGTFSHVIPVRIIVSW